MRKKPHDRSLSHFDTIPACDRWTDGQTDRQTDVLCNNCTSYAGAL